MDRQRDFKRFPLQVLFDEIREEHYPETQRIWEQHHRKSRESSYNVSKPKVACIWPAAYIDAYTVHTYRSMVLNEPGVEPYELKKDHHPMMPRRFYCPQCEEGFETMAKFKKHIGAGE